MQACEEGDALTRRHEEKVVGSNTGAGISLRYKYIWKQTPISMWKKQLSKVCGIGGLQTEDLEDDRKWEVHMTSSVDFI